MSGGMRTSAVPAQRAVPAENGKEEIQKLFESALEQIQDPEEKENLRAIMEKILNGSGSEDDMEKIAELLGMTPDALAFNLGVSQGGGSNGGDIK